MSDFGLVCLFYLDSLIYHCHVLMLSIMYSWNYLRCSLYLTVDLSALAFSYSDRVRHVPDRISSFSNLSISRKFVSVFRFRSFRIRFRFRIQMWKWKRYRGYPDRVRLLSTLVAGQWNTSASMIKQIYSKAPPHELWDLDQNRGVLVI
jgi:hypothetical protein